MLFIAWSLNGNAIGIAPGTLLLPLMLNLATQVQIYRVQATGIGFYAGDMYGPGEVFDVPANEFSDSTVDQTGGATGGPMYGWMTRVPANTPLSNPTGQVYDWPSARRLVF